METFRFGLLADTQYADRPVSEGRYYRNSIAKTEWCLERFRQENTDFCIHLGDMVDWPDDPEKGLESLNRYLPVLCSAGIPVKYVLGNHDLATVPCPELQKRLGLKGGTWYSFDHKGVHFIVLDCNFDARGEWYCPEHSEWDQCFVPQRELDWLGNDLRKAEPDTVLVFVHALLDDLDDPHVIRNAFQMREILEHSRKRIAVFQGHMHCGRESETNGIRYHTLAANVIGRTHRCCWVLEANEREIFAKRYDSLINCGMPREMCILKSE